MFYEIIYETGNHSIASYEDDTEAIRAIGEHHRRAKAGEKAQESNPEMGPAERIVKVLKYDEHPGTAFDSNVATEEEIADVVNIVVTKKGHGGVVSLGEVAAAVRNISNPTVDSKPHDSNYKLEEVGTLEGWDI